jgi:RNA recognition motif-containing protein
MAKKIYVGRISSTTTDKNLFDHFSQVGKVIAAKISLGINAGKNAGYGYVTMGSDHETEEAIKRLNNSKLEGNSIKVMEAHYLDQERERTYSRRNYQYKSRK